MSQLANTVKSAIIEAIEKDQITLPTLPEVALKVREAAEDPNASAASLAQVLRNDAALSARIIRVVNSPLFRTSREVDDIKMAVNRLGIDYTCNLATGLAMKQMFQATSDHIDRILRDVWTHSTQVGAISHLLAKQYTKLRPDRATLGGLVHSIGILPILTFAEENSSLLRDSFSLNHVIEATHAEIGCKILQAWDFPAELASIPRDYLKFDRQCKTADYTDLVLISNLQCYAGTNHPLAQVDVRKVSAFQRLGLDPEALKSEEVQADIEAAMAVFN